MLTFIFNSSISIHPVILDSQFFYCDKKEHWSKGYPPVMLLFLVLSFIVFRTTRAAMLLFFCCSLYLSYVLSIMCLLLGLLLVLIYLGALMVLFAFMWIYIAFDKHAWYLQPFPFFFVVLLSRFSPSPPSSLLAILLPSGFLLFLVCLLFWAIVVMVHILDLSLGGFTN